MKPLLLLVLPLALVACSPGPEHAAATPAPAQAAAPATPGATPDPALAAALAAHPWHLASATAADGGRIDALFANAEAPLQLEFVDGRVSVTNACNSMSGDFTLEAGQVTFAPMVGTQMACAEPLMAMEREANTRLAGSHALALQSGDPPRLELANGLGDRLVFRGAPIE
jgi:heat shock protein HslJ